jgi:hypothetical protein
MTDGLAEMKTRRKRASAKAGRGSTRDAREIKLDHHVLRLVVSTSDPWHWDEKIPLVQCHLARVWMSLGQTRILLDA